MHFLSIEVYSIKTLNNSKSAFSVYVVQFRALSNMISDSLSFTIHFHMTEDSFLMLYMSPVLSIIHTIWMSGFHPFVFGL